MANNIPRQAPSPGPQHATANGAVGAGANMNGFPPAGQQSDLSHLWGLVQQLSEQLAENRAHTANIVGAMDQIQSRAAADGSPPTLSEVNGELHAARAAELAQLQSQTAQQERQIQALQTSLAAEQSLRSEYENAMGVILEKLRPYAFNHTQAVVHLHAHYNHLLEQERDANLQLRLEHQGWQARLMNLNELIRKAYNEDRERTLPFVRRIAELKTENRTLRRLAGWPEAEDWSDEEGEEAPLGHGEG